MGASGDKGRGSGSRRGGAKVTQGEGERGHVNDKCGVWVSRDSGNLL